jgi:hypothetical protein
MDGWTKVVLEECEAAAAEQPDCFLAECAGVIRMLLKERDEHWEELRAYRTKCHCLIVE